MTWKDFLSKRIYRRKSNNKVLNQYDISLYKRKLSMYTLLELPESKTQQQSWERLWNNRNWWGCSGEDHCVFVVEEWCTVLNKSKHAQIAWYSNYTSWYFPSRVGNVCLLNNIEHECLLNIAFVKTRMQASSLLQVNRLTNYCVF